MVPHGAIALLLLLWANVALPAAAATTDEYGCDLAVEQPCRSNASLCVALEHVNDGFIDCPDGSDEGCGEGWFVCEDRSACVAPDLLQDGVPDCFDESDEVCEEWQHECLCGFPRCIPRSFVGDGHPDCLEGSDELSIDKSTYICPSEVSEEQQLRRRRKRQTEAPLSIPVQGTFFSQASDGHSRAHVQVSLKDTALSPSSVADEVVTLTGTQGKFIKDGPSHATTFSVFTGTYVKDLRTYLFFFGNTILPPVPGAATPELITKTRTEVVVRKGGDQSKIMVDMNKDLQVIMPSKTQTMVSTKAPDLLMGEGVMDGQVMGGVFIEGSEGFDMEGTQMSSESGKTSMLEVTITRPLSSTVMLQPSSTLPAEEVTVLTMVDKLGLTDDVDNEIEGTLLRARKARISGGEIIADLRTSRPLEVNLPTYTVGHSNLPLEQVVAFSKNGGKTTETSVEKTVSEKHQESNQREAKSVSDIRERFNLERGGEDSDLPTVTYVGFADFVTTIANTVVVFTPRTDAPNKIIKPSVSKTREVQAPTAFRPSPLETPSSPTTLAPRLASSRHAEEAVIEGSPTDALGLHPSVQHGAEKPEMKTRMVTQTGGTSLRADQEEVLTEELPGSVFSTVSTKRFNTIDLYPTGLVSYIGGTIVRDDMTTLLTTYVYGTYIQGQYAQIVQSTSSIFYLVSRSALPEVQATSPVQPIAATLETQAPELTTEFSDIYDYDYEGFTTELGPVEDIVDNALGRSVGSNADQQLIVDTVEEKPVAEDPEPTTPQPPEEASGFFTTLTHFTTYFTDGTTSVATRYETSSAFLPFFGVQDSTTDPTPVDEEMEPTEVSPVHLTTYTYYTTLFVDGSSQVSSRIEVFTKEADDTSSSLTPSFLAPTPTVAPVQPLLTTTLSTTTAVPGTTEDTTESPAVEEDLAVIEAISVDEPIPTTESFTESMSESMSESSTDSTGQDVTEVPKATLESSLNPEDEVNVAFYPRTYYTTYTYFTTYYRAGSSSIVSSLETLTNVVTDPSDHDQHQTLTPVVPTYPVTYYTTYTFWTTFFKGTSTISTSSEKTLSNVVTPAVKETATPITHGDLIPVIDASPTSATSPAATTATITAVTPTPAVTTFYTTYTYYTSTYVGDKTIVNSRLETITNVVSSSVLPGGVRPLVTLDDVFGFGTTTPTTATTPSSEVTLPLDLFGFDETTTSKSEATLPLDLFGFGVTTTPSQEGTQPQFPTKTKSTGLLSTIRGSTVVDGTTTIFSTNVIGTVVDGLYAQIQSTTSIVIRPTSEVAPIFDDRNASPTLPSFFLPTTAVTDDSHATIDPDIATENEGVEAPAIFATPTLESSIQDEATDTMALDAATEALPSDATTEEPEEASPTGVSKPKSKPTSRNNFPVRPSGSRRRPDIFPFLRRTNFRSATITRGGLTPTVTATPADSAAEDDTATTTANRPFRFGFLDTTTTAKTTTTRDSIAPSSVRFRFQSPKPGGPKGSSRPGLFGPSSIRGSSPGFRFGASSPGAFPGVSSPGGFRFGGTRSSVFPGSINSVKPTSVFPKLATTAAPESDLDPFEEEPLQEEPEVEEELSDTEVPSVNFRPFSFRPRQAPSTEPGTRSSVPFALLNRRPDIPPTRRQNTPSRFSPQSKKSVANSPEDAVEKKRTTTPRPTPSQRLNRLSLEERRRNRIRQSRPDLSKLFARRNPLKKDLDNEATEVEPVYVDPTGAAVENSDVTLVRKKRQANRFGMRTTSRGTTRLSTTRSRDSLPIAPPRSSRFSRQRPAASPVTPKDDTQQFTLRSGTRPARGRTPAPPTTPERRTPPVRQPQRATRPSTSRTTLPTRPRGPSRTRDTVPLGNIPGRGFRRPSTDNNFRTSSKFTPPRSASSPIRRPALRRNTNVNTNRKRLQVTGNSNPIKEFRNRPAPPVTTEAPSIFPSEDGTFLIQDDLTVTREVPVKATIPLVEEGETVMKEVITASYKTEVIQKDQITQTEINGAIRLLLSSVETEKMVTKYIIEPVNTTTVTNTPTFVEGRRTSASVTLPSTAYNIVSVTMTKGGGEIQQLLQLLLGQPQQPQNPFLAAFGLGGQQTPSYITHTSTYVTTVTNVVSTAIPIIFRGKPVHTTIVESKEEVVTATELSTETVLGAPTALPFANPNPINPLLPLLLQGQLQQQTAQNRPSREPSKSDPLQLEHLLKQKHSKENKLKRLEGRQLLPSLPAPVQTSVVTMYVSGRRPGEFSTVLSTVILSGEATRRKRGSEKTQGVEATVLPHFIETDKGVFELPREYSEDDMDWFIMSAMNEIDVSGVTKVTPALDSVLGDLAQDYYQYVMPNSNGTHSFNTSPFLWAGPAEFAPLKRNVRSAQRGNTGEPKARKIEDGTLQQTISDNDGKRLSLEPLEVAGNLNPEQVLAPTTYYTTFTYYTTLVDDTGREYVQSSEETLTQLATRGSVVLDDFTRTSQEGKEEDLIQEKFTLEDAILPGKPRPVPDPVFTEPPPPFGPVIRHRMPDPDFESEPNRPPRISGTHHRVAGESLLESSLLESELPELQRPRRIVLTRKRPVGQNPESRVRTVVTRRRPVNQLDDGPISSAVGSTPEEPLHLQIEKEHLIEDFQKLNPSVDDVAAKPTHEVMEIEEQDRDEEVAGQPGNRRRVRITVTSRRPVQLTKTAEADKTMTLSGGRRRVVVTRRLPQPTVVASPLRPLVATVSTYYTIYSYLYSLYESNDLVSVSTREVTVSNEIEPTAVSVLPTFQTGMTASGLYTLETGSTVATLGERVFQSLTTQIFLSSATLINLTPEAIKENAQSPRTSEDSRLPSSISGVLQSSLAEDDVVLPTDTPFITTSSFRATQERDQTTAERQVPDSTPLSHHDATATLQSPAPSRAGVRNNGRGTVRFAFPRQKVKVTVTRKRPVAPATRQPSPALTPSRQLSPGLSPTRQHSPGFTPTRQLSPGRSPTRQLSPGRSPTRQLSPGRSPTRQLSPGFTPTRQLSSGRSPVRQLSPGLSPTGQFSPGLSPTRQVSPAPLPTHQLSPALTQTPPEDFLPSTTPVESELGVLDEYDEYDLEQPEFLEDEVPPPSERPPTDSRFRFSQEQTSPALPIDDDSFILTSKEKTIVEQEEEITTTPKPPVTPAPTPVRPTRPPRSSIRRDDIPIIRRPGFERPSRPFVKQQDSRDTTPATEPRLRFSPTPQPQSEPSSEAPPKSEVTPPPTAELSDLSSRPKPSETPLGETDEQPAEDDYLYDDYYDYYYYDEEETPDVPAPEQELPQPKEQPSLPEAQPPHHPPSQPHLPESRPRFTSPSLVETPLSTLDTFAPAGTREHDATSDADQTEAPDVPPGLIYTTFATTTLLPILGGERSITLTIMTSSLTTPSLTLPFFNTASPSLAEHTPTTSTVLSSPSAPPPSLEPSSPPGDDTQTPVVADPLPEVTSPTAPAQPDSSLAFGIFPDSPVADSGDKTALPLPQDQVISSNFEKFRRPITLPPSTLSDEMLLFASPETERPKVTQLAGGDDGTYQTNTYFTTYTYYNTLLAGNKPFVITSKQTLENVVTVALPHTGSFIEHTEVTFETHTYYKTQTFTRTVGEEESQSVITSHDVVTQVVITEAPTVERTSVTPSQATLVTKTYFTTLTYYNTAVEGGTTVINSNTVVSSEVVTETAYITKTPSLDLSELGLAHTATSQSGILATTQQDDLVLYATKTVYTTLTYLTTILEGSDTITTSSIDISSSVITEPVTTALSHEELSSLRESFLADQVTPTAFGGPQPHSVSYIKIRDNVYKQLRTLFATYTHFTTLHNGEVQSRLETKTKVLTSTVTTSSVAASLLITPTSLTEIVDFGASTVAPGVDSSTPVQLDPSYLSSLKSSYLALKPTSLGNLGEEEGLQATVLVEEGDASGTFVVSDSTTSATLLVGPTDVVSTSVTTGQTIVIFDPEHLSSLKLSYQSSLAAATPVTTPSPISQVTPEGPSTNTPIFVSGSPEDIDPTTPDPVTPTSPDTPESPATSETVPSSSESTSPEATPSPEPEVVTSDGSIVTTEDGSQVVSPTPAVVPPPAPAPAPAPASISVQGGTTGVPPVSSGGVSPGEYSLTGSSDNALNIDLGPMLTAVAGLLRNNLNSQSIIAKSDGDVNNRRKSPPLRPTNTLISPQREPLLIPVGGVGASLSITKSHTLGPEQGFIPLRRPDSSSPQSQPRFPGQAPGLEDPHSQGFIKIEPGKPRPVFSAPTSIADMEGFGPTFLPPQTLVGFTAMTDDNIASTRVAVIAGSPTIFFGGVGPHDLPPPGQPAAPETHEQNIDRGTVIIHPSRAVPEGQTRPVPVPVRVPLPGDGGPIPLPVLPEGFTDQEASGDIQPDLVSSRPNPHHPQPSLVGPQTIVSIEGDNRIVGTQVIHGHPTTQRLPEPPIIVSPAGGEYVLHSTVGVGIISGEPDDDRPLPPPGFESTVISGAETVLLGQGIDKGRTTVVRGSSTVLSGATTIFGSLFTRPASSSESDLTAVVSGPRGVPTRFITRVETVPRTVTATHTEFVYTAGVTSTLTQVVYSTLPPRTIVSTIVGTATRVNYVTVTVTPDGAAVTSGLPGVRDSTTYPPGSPFDPANYPSFPLDPNPQEEELRLPGDAEVVLSEDTLGIAEDNEISKVVESKSPDQEISLGGPLRAPVSLCDPQCSAARYEVCRLIRGEHTCVCRSGYSRRNEYDACKPSLAYNIQILLDRMSDGQLVFDDVLHNSSHPITQDLSDITTHGISQAMMDSPLGSRYHTATITKFSDTRDMVMPATVHDMEHGLVADVKVEFLRDTEGAEELEMDEARVRQALESVLKRSNYSLGGSGLFTSKAEAVLSSEDFNECIFEDHNDCSTNANCFNTPGSYLCACRDGFKDISDLPGRECAVQTEQCAQCNFQGECVVESDGSVGCRCLQWFSGNRCQINLRVMLIALVTVGSLLILLLLLCLVLCCMRARRNTRDKLAQVPGAPTFLRARSTDMSGTLDRRAMIHETSSESSVEHPRHHHHNASFMTPSSSEKAERVVRIPRSEISTSRRSQSSFAEDRSVGVHTTLPPVLIPRVKGPAPPRPSVVSRDKDGEPRVMIGADARSDLASSQQAFVDLLDPPGPAVCHSSRRESMTAASIHSSARINRSRSHSRERLSDAFLHQLHPQGSTRSRSTDRLHNSTHDLNSEFGVNFSFRGDGERTMSVARSYDETTVRPPIRSLRAESFYSSKALSSQHISEHQTMAERDGGSTVVYPQTELYRPVRDNDSISDMSEQHSKVTSSRGASRNFFS